MFISDIVLREISFNVLKFLENQEPMRACDIAEALGLNTKQVDAAVTKSLVRYGLALREAHITKMMKKEYSLIKITPRGKEYLNQINQIGGS